MNSRAIGVVTLILSAAGALAGEAGARPGAVPAGAPTEAECIALATKIEQTVNAGDGLFFDGAADVDAMVDEAAKGIGAPAALLQGFRAGVKRSTKMGAALAAVCKQGGSFKLLRIHASGGKPRALFRLITGSGVNYQDLVLARSRGGGVRIVDIHIFLSGELLSATLRRSYVQAVASENRGILDRVLGKENDFVANLPRIQEMQRLGAAGKHAEALRICAALPASLQGEKLILVQRLVFATRVGGAAYERAVADFRRHFPKDPALDLISIDAHVVRKEHEKALACVERLDKVVRDPYLDVLRANIHLESGRPVESEKCARRAAEREPALAEAYWTIAGIALQRKEFAKLATALDEIEQKLGVEFGDLTKVPAYAEFVKSPEHAEWLARRKAKAGAGGTGR